MKKLSVGSMEESDAQWEINAHNPELRGTWKMAVEDVGEEAENEVDVECSDTSDTERKISDADVVKTTMAYQEDRADSQ